jgi:hypothetical protein
MVLGRQAGTDLEERLAVPVRQLVKDDPARGVGQGLEDVSHAPARYASRCLPVKAELIPIDDKARSQLDAVPGLMAGQVQPEGVGVNA